jgi:hypothetical protein
MRYLLCNQQFVLIAVQEKLHPSGLYLRYIVDIKSNNLQSAQEYFFQTLSHKEVNLDMALAVCHSAFEHKCAEMALKGYELLLQKFTNHPGDTYHIISNYPNEQRFWKDFSADTRSAVIA